ncbi:MAG: carboxypeptidase-like regulatory domain-containing protein [Acidobacteria bacterium]|nr:carboxypeptidase-like regulatory domain-containing protein [Acidobacteriota bacterium]
MKMRKFARRLSSTAPRLLFVLAFALGCAAPSLAQSQSNAADLQGYVRDAQGAVVTGANVTARNKATGLERSATSNDEGFYKIVNLPPGDYEVVAEAANFSKVNIPVVTITVGQRADLDIPLAAGQVSESVTVTGASTQVVETSRTAVATTVDQQRIENLPINERNYINFAPTIRTRSRRSRARSTARRSAGRSIATAPSSSPPSSRGSGRSPASSRAT